FLIGIGVLGVILIALVLFLIFRSHGGQAEVTSGGMPKSAAEEFTRRMEQAHPGQSGPTAPTMPTGTPAGVGGMPPGVPTSPPGVGSMPAGVPTRPPGQ